MGKTTYRKIECTYQVNSICLFVSKVWVLSFSLLFSVFSKLSTISMYYFYNRKII